MASLEQLVAARVRQARKRADFTLEQLAQKIGVETTTLSRYERGLRALNLEMLERVAKALGVSIGSLLDDGKPGGGSVADEEGLRKGKLWKTLEKGGNAALLGEQLVCLGMTRDRALFNTELYEKCARAYVIAKASDKRINHIPFWVRMIANRRLLKDEAVACLSYSEGRIPEGIHAY